MNKLRIVQILVSVTALGFILYKVPISTLSATLFGSNPNWLLAAVGFAALMISVRWLKWYGLLKSEFPDTSKSLSARSLLGGFSLSIMTPGRLGELGRAFFLPAPSRSGAFVLNCVDRSLDFWGLVTFAVVSLFSLAPLRVAVVAGVIWVALLPLIALLPRVISWVARIPLLPKKVRFSFSHALHSKPSIPRFAFLSILSTFLDMMAFYALLRAFTEVEFTVALVAFPWILLASGIPITVAGFGLREGAAMTVLSSQGVASEVAINAALLIFVVSTVLPGAVGALLVLQSSLRRSDNS
ncbi:MAG: lysylphosphatidylglycerol synthase transmembrane domain-containing protein [Acidobacteriota bacterium]